MVLPALRTLLADDVALIACRWLPVVSRCRGSGLVMQCSSDPGRLAVLAGYRYSSRAAAQVQMRPYVRFGAKAAVKASRPWLLTPLECYQEKGAQHRAHDDMGHLAVGTTVSEDPRR
jgi:hypothetical protein